MGIIVDEVTLKKNTGNNIIKNNPLNEGIRWRIQTYFDHYLAYLIKVLPKYSIGRMKK